MIGLGGLNHTFWSVDDSVDDSDGVLKNLYSG